MHRPLGEPPAPGHPPSCGHPSAVPLAGCRSREQPRGKEKGWGEWGTMTPPLTVPPAASKPRLAQGRRGGDAGGRRSPAGAVNLPGRVKAGNGCCAVDGSAVGYWGSVWGGGEGGMPQPPPPPQHLWGSEPGAVASCSLQTPERGRLARKQRKQRFDVSRQRKTAAMGGGGKGGRRGVKALPAEPSARVQAAPSPPRPWDGDAEVGAHHHGQDGGTHEVTLAVSSPEPQHSSCSRGIPLRKRWFLPLPKLSSPLAWS